MFFGDVLVWADWASLRFYHRSSQQPLGKGLLKSASDTAFHRRVCSWRTTERTFGAKQCFPEAFFFFLNQYQIDAVKTTTIFIEWRKIQMDDSEEKHSHLNNVSCFGSGGGRQKVQGQWGHQGHLVEELPAFQSQNSFHPMSPSRHTEGRCVTM